MPCDDLHNDAERLQSPAGDGRRSRLLPVRCIAKLDRNFARLRLHRTLNLTGNFLKIAVQGDCELVPKKRQMPRHLFVGQVAPNRQDDFLTHGDRTRLQRIEFRLWPVFTQEGFAEDNNAER